MATVGVYAQSNYPFNGLDMNMGNLSRLSDAKTRSISPENFTGEKGKGGMADPVRDKDQRNVANAHHAAKDLGKGWKVNPFIIVKPGETITIAEIEGPGAIQQIWMTPTGNWRFSILRMYWDDEKEPSVECPVGDFFCSAYNEYAQALLTGRLRESGQRLQLLLEDAFPQESPYHAGEHQHRRGDAPVLPNQLHLDRSS